MPLHSLSRPLPQQQLLLRVFWMRCIAMLAQLALVAAVALLIELTLPLQELFSLFATMALFNAFTWWRSQRRRPVHETELLLQLFVDVSALSLVLYFTGGATNPFVSFYLPTLAVAAAILPTSFALLLALYSLICYSLLTTFYQPLHVHDAMQGMHYHLIGMWLNFLVSAALITWFVTRMSATVRGREAQLAQAREQHLLDERIVALGTQAASAAHEMGTPLSTVALIAGELHVEASRNEALRPFREDLTIIEEQIVLCKTALDKMSMHGKPSATEAVLSLTDWLRHFFNTWRLRHPAVAVRLSLDETSFPVTQPQLLAQVLSTLLDNAAQAVGNVAVVELELRIHAASITICVRDEGPGIAAELLTRLGYEPVRSTTGGKGIGLMLAFAMARQLGARLALASRQGQGTTALLTLPLSMPVSIAVSTSRPAVDAPVAPPIKDRP
ncbi:two-component system sensor histidine kinase RegB [Herbaspirillum sp. Sphag1AN]|uniref:ATP-binding protein n=1 Tax=unclassified Herbaspirillum TaxID=2624150 RepID=UPI001612C627|nr:MULTISPECIES: ATP-binding protein [unclassified Herbaspirillum]MBB3211999.1 two-component system sensor histidine kinase RegB [Herbaspirillum sp. Sphag1AN]MBB3244167.1 two-component system sensor histidine kinase RegB [Herbaspirillum sp. Sphag64]